MQEQSRYAVGIDIGTKTVRCVVGYFDASSGTPKIVGVGQAPNSGMRKGVVTSLTGPAAAIDKALEDAERMSGHQVDTATISVNGAHLLSTKADGMITVGTANAEVTAEDVARLEDVSLVGKLPQNREVLEVVPHAYRLDGQDNIKDPIGMTGARLEMKANVVSGLTPHIVNVRRAAEMAKVEAAAVVPAVLASAQAVLTESQKENGVAILDIGAATTGVAVFEEGDLQYLSVVPVGGQNVTNDLAIGLRTNPEVAEVVKLTHAKCGSSDAGEVETKHQKATHVFRQEEINEIVEARYEEIFELVNKELKRAGRAGKLPNGVVLVGGGAKIAGLVDMAKEQLGVAACLGAPDGANSVGEEVKTPDYAAAVGLMLMDASVLYSRSQPLSMTKSVAKKTGGFLGNLFARFK